MHRSYCQFAMRRAVQRGSVRRILVALRDGVRGDECVRAADRADGLWSGKSKRTFASHGWIKPCYVKGDRHCFTTSTDFRSKEADSSIKRVPVKVGAELRICVADINVDVDVATGDSLEEIVLEALWKDGRSADHWSDFQLIESSDCVKLQNVRGTRGHGDPVPEGIRAAMPARWCGLFVQAKQNPVRIQSLREGNLNVETSGGDVTLGDMRGGKAKILTNGGCFTADLVSADSVVKTAGGDVSIKRLVGTTIDVDTNGGDMYIGSLYGNDVVMKLSGGSFEAKHIQAQDSALISTKGGSVQITGIDGKASIVTRGGDVSLQLHEHAREINIDASEGNVTLYFSNNLSAQVEYNGGKNIHQTSQLLVATPLPAQYVFVGQESGNWMHGDDSRANRAEEASQASAEVPQLCKIKIISSGSLHVKMRSWIDVAMASSVPNFVKW
ncbi:uncharacterized protein [Physcomitrium patens]|uniref:DUF4097 domain-containing protein n=1 Tax=Physcomitrium patens TaxID=3218 RepID=A0A7I4EM00_PHYPA|nr:uncharacterized protein LOC112286401 isoform X2 [Physcomitrium patens]|eukprot:XP_024384031.1 uncharacterized protein LOC112286401 isoform X2 [Physcomitrella patens]